MKSIISKTVAAGLIMTGVVLADELVVEEVVVSDVPATEVSVTADFASAYVFRGVTLNEDAVFQPGLEATGFGLKEGWGSLTIGAWGNFDFGDNDGTLKESEFSEVDLYASYSLPTLVDGLDIFVGWTEYTYPTSDAGADKEANVGLGYEVIGIGLGATAYIGTGGAIHGSTYYELAAGYDLELTDGLGLSLGASAGYLDPDSGEDGWNDGTVSAAISYAVCENWSIGASIAYIGQLDDDVLVDEDDGGGYDVDTVGMLSLAGSF
jgi:uncharacterized protein (TIGR02001 family)